MDHAEPDGYLCERVRRALADQLGELGVDVRVAGRRAFLLGTVPTAERQAEVAEVVAGVLPGWDVHNDVTVTPLGGGPEVEVVG